MKTDKHELLEKLIPDYSSCLVNLANSILKKFGAETTAATLPLADKALTGNHKNVVVLLLDALGVSILEKHLKPEGFFRSHVADVFDSVYPPTTVAATTSLMSGLYPNEHGWLGWDIYYPQIDKNVTVFRNIEQHKEKPGAKPDVDNASGKALWSEASLTAPVPAADYHVGRKFTPYKSVIQKINENGGRAYYSMPFEPPFPHDLEAILKRIKELCAEDGQKYIYAYWNEPDGTMHRTGTVSAETHEIVCGLEKRIEQFASELEDTLIIITADHSHIDSHNLCILDYPEIMNCLVRRPSIEPRTVNLFVKDEYKESFPALFKKIFGEAFLLLSREEVLECRLFGTGCDREGLEKMIGDFVALAVSDTSITNTHFEAQKMPGMHAGLTQEEIKIPLIVVER